MALLLACALTVPSHAQGPQYLCRTAPVGESTHYCASEAFVTKSRGSLPNQTFATLGACTSGNKGQVAFISDSNVSTFNANITAGGGSNLGLAVCNGTNWTFH